MVREPLTKKIENLNMRRLFYRARHDGRCLSSGYFTLLPPYALNTPEDILQLLAVLKV